MKEQIKSMPFGVKVATLFLLAVYALMCMMAPIVWFALTVGLGTILSIARIIHYLSHGN